MDIRDFTLRVYLPGKPQPSEAIDFIYEILYKPFGHASDGPWLDSAQEDNCFRVIAFDQAQRVMGTARLMEDAQIKVVATSEAVRGQGVGRLLMDRIEALAREQECSELWLNARIPAIGFYRHLGFVQISDEFINQPSGLAHVKMHKLFARQ